MNEEEELCLVIATDINRERNTIAKVPKAYHRNDEFEHCIAILKAYVISKFRDCITKIDTFKFFSNAGSGRLKLYDVEGNVALSSSAYLDSAFHCESRCIPFLSVDGNIVELEDINKANIHIKKLNEDIDKFIEHNNSYFNLD